jgi:hypothetical protein
VIILETMYDIEEMENQINREFHFNRPIIEVDRLNPFMNFLKHVYRKVHREKWNALNCAVGLPRTGKSLFSTWSSKLLNWNKFNMRDDLLYTSNDFSARLERISDASYGETLIWDEAGVGIPAREWFRVQNREIGKMLQTAGHLRPIVWFVSPDFSFIDSQPKKLFHYFFECANRTSNYVIVKPYSIKVYRRTGKLMFAYPRIRYHGVQRLKAVHFYSPPLDFIKEYEGLSDPRKKKMRTESDRLLTGGDIKKLDLRGMKKFIIANADQFKEDSGQIDAAKLHTYFSDVLRTCPDPVAQAQAMAMEVNKIFARVAREKAVAAVVQSKTISDDFNELEAAAYEVREKGRAIDDLEMTPRTKAYFQELFEDSPKKVEVTRKDEEEISTEGD